MVHGMKTRIFGAVASVCADNAGSSRSSLGGFKESGSAYRLCRQCLITCNEVQTVVSSSSPWSLVQSPSLPVLDVHKLDK